MSPKQSNDEKGSEVFVKGEEEDPISQMLNDLSLGDAKKVDHNDPANDLVEGLKGLDIKKEEDEVSKDESESEEETEEPIKTEKLKEHKEDEYDLAEETEELKRPKELDEDTPEPSICSKDVKSAADETSEESDDENPPDDADDDAYSNDKSFEPEKDYELQSFYKPDLEPSSEKSSMIKSQDVDKTKKPKTRYASRGLGGGGMEFQNAFPEQFMYQDQFRAAAPFSTMQPNSSPAYAWSPDNSQNSSPTHAWSTDNAQNGSPTHAWTPDNSFTMDAFDSSAFNSPPYMSGSDSGNQGSASQIYMNQGNNYLDQYSYPLTPPFSDGASIQDESDFSEGVPSPLAPSQQEFNNEYAMPHDEHSLDDILEVLNQEKFGGLDVTGCVPPEKIMPYLQELLRIPEGSENTDNSSQEVSQIQPRPQVQDNFPDGRSQTSAEHEIRKRINPEVLEKTTRQINYQENEKLCEKDEEGDTPYMVVVSNYERKNYYELLYAMQERLKTIRMCCDLPVCVRTHSCKVCGNTDDLQFYSPLSMRNNVGDTALKNAVLMKFPKEVVNYLCGGLEERQGDMRRVFDMETSNFFQQNSFIYPVLARFL